MPAIFQHAWLCIARIEDLPSPGDWLAAPITPAGILLVRQNDLSLRAFHAVCTHRGTAFLKAECGSDQRFTCPYHDFQFELDGRACANVDDLAEVRVATAHGFVFVTLLSDAPPLDDALGEVPPWLAGRALPPLKRVNRVGYDIAARFGLVLENFQESLHFASVHPALEALTPSALAETWTPSTGGPWLGGLMPLDPAAETVSISGKRNGRPFLVADNERRTVRDAVRFPNLMTSLQPDYLLVFLLFPKPDGGTRVVASTYVDADCPDDAVADVTAFWARAHEEDRIACERQERGARSLDMRANYTDVEEGAAAIARMVAHGAPSAPRPTKAAARHCGIFGQPYADLSELVDIASFPALHDELTRGLATVETGYTGGTLKWMGVCAPWVDTETHRDAMHAIQKMTRAERAELVALANEANEAAPDDDRAPPDLDDPLLTFGDETERPFSMAQARFLEQRHGVYFPWKVCYHLVENDLWEDKHQGHGKGFSEEARRVFPRTVAFIESLPFVEIGRVVVFGLLANDHAPAHRDSEPGKALSIAQSISFEPSRRARGPGAERHKRFYLTTPDGANEEIVDAPIYWFNDMDWHGVHADPFFRYSVRVDGVFEPGFLEKIRRSVAGRRA